MPLLHYRYLWALQAHVALYLRPAEFTAGRSWIVQAVPGVRSAVISAQASVATRFSTSPLANP